MNCLKYNLLYWNDNRSSQLVYDADHVLCIFPPLDLTEKGFLDITEYGLEHMVSSFQLKNGFYLELLKEYYESRKERIIKETMDK